MIYLISKKTDEVKMVSKDKIIYDPNLFYEKEINDNDFEGFRMIFDKKNNKLIKEKLDKTVDLKSEIDSAKDITELKQIIKKLI